MRGGHKSEVGLFRSPSRAHHPPRCRPSATEQTPKEIREPSAPELHRAALRKLHQISPNVAPRKACSTQQAIRSTNLVENADGRSQGTQVSFKVRSMAKARKRDATGVRERLQRRATRLLTRAFRALLPLAFLQTSTMFDPKSLSRWHMTTTVSSGMQKCRKDE